MVIKEICRAICTFLLSPILALGVFYDAHRPYNSYFIGRLLIKLGLVCGNQDK
jgi:hypothetical protein